mgnify:CR=1 FL=1
MKMHFLGTKLGRKWMNKGFVLGLWAVFTVASDLYGQSYKNYFVPYSTVGFGVGTSSYYGDLAAYRRVVGSTFKMIRWNVSGEYTRHFTPRFAARASLTWARIAGDDFVMNQNRGKVNNNLFLRNLHFRNDIKELAAVGIYKITPDGRSYDRRSQFGAYVFGGVALFAHNPKARLPVDPVTLEKQRWVALQPLGTEGQGQVDGPKLYSLVNVAFPIGFGLRYKVNPKFDISAELGFRFTNSDYLDDVSQMDYPDPSTFAEPTGMELSNRAFEVIPARKPKRDRTALLQEYLGLSSSQDPYAYLQQYPDLIGPRGTKPNRADAYMTGTIKLIYVLGPSVKCPPLK